MYRILLVLSAALVALAAPAAANAQNADRFYALPVPKPGVGNDIRWLVLDRYNGTVKLCEASASGGSSCSALKLPQLGKPGMTPHYQISNALNHGGTSRAMAFVLLDTETGQSMVCINESNCVVPK